MYILATHIYIVKEKVSLAADGQFIPPPKRWRTSCPFRLKGVGSRGQKKLLQSRVLIIGAGGLGAPAAMYLAAAGVGTIGIADADKVELSNLQRQIIHTTGNLGKEKTDSAKETIRNLNPDVNVITYPFYLNSSNILDIVRVYDFIIDGTDNFDTKFLINDACVISEKPFCYAGILQFQGQLMTYVPGKGPCYRCIFKEPPSVNSVPSCRQAGVIGAIAGVIGSLQAMEAIKYLLGNGELLTGYLLTYDALKTEFRKVKLPEHKEHLHTPIIKLTDYNTNYCRTTPQI